MPSGRPRSIVTWSVAVVLCLGLIVGTVVEDTTPVILFAAIIGAIVAFVLWIYDGIASSRQRDEFVQFAERHGWSFWHGTYEYGHRFASFPFDRGGRTRQENVLKGVLDGVQCATFTQVIVSVDAEGRETEEPYQVTLVELPVVLPRLEVVPETVAQKFVKSLGGGDLDVESYEFNRKWRVLCRDAKYAHAVLDPRMVERLLQPDALELAIRIEGGAVLAWQPGRVGTATLARRLGVLAAVARRIPEHVVREYRDRGAINTPASERPFPPTAPAWATTPGALTRGYPTEVEPGPPATGERWEGLPDGNSGFDIFNALTFRWQ